MSVRTLLLLVTACALLILAGNFIRYRFFQLPNHPQIKFASSIDLREAVKRLNRQVDSFALRPELKLHETEIVTALQCQNLTPDEWFTTQAAQQTLAARLDVACKQITVTKTLPPGTELEMTRDGTVVMHVPFDTVNGYGFFIRHPSLTTTPSGVTMQYHWRPKPDTKYVWDGSQWTEAPD